MSFQLRSLLGRVSPHRQPINEVLVARQHADLAALLEADEVTLIQMERIMELRQKGSA